MPLAKGDSVLVPFPFTDLGQTKLSPSVIVGRSKGYGGVGRRCSVIYG